MRWILWAFVLCCGTSLMGCSPGMLDGISAIPNSGGYGLSDSGGDERAIVHKADGEDKWKLVIDARVDGYLMRGENLYIARRPKIRDVTPSGFLDGRVASECEIWVVNTASHSVVKATSSKNAPVACL